MGIIQNRGVKVKGNPATEGTENTEDRRFFSRQDSQDAQDLSGLSVRRVGRPGVRYVGLFSTRASARGFLAFAVVLHTTFMADLRCMRVHSVGLWVINTIDGE